MYVRSWIGLLRAVFSILSFPKQTLSFHERGEQPAPSFNIAETLMRVERNVTIKLIIFMLQTRRGFATNDKLCCNGDASYV